MQMFNLAFIWGLLMDTLLNTPFHISLQTTPHCWKLFRADCH